MEHLNLAELSTASFSIRPFQTEPVEDQITKLEGTTNRCFRLIESLSDESKQQITALADRRLARLGIWHTSGNDLLQEAFFKVLSGSQSGHGRRPRPEHLKDATAFTNYLKKIISSQITVHAAMGMHRLFYEPIHDLDHQVETAYSTTPAKSDDYIGFTDLRDALFYRLKSRCPTNIQTTLDRWEETCGWSDGIPFGGIGRHQRLKLLALAQDICEELGESWP